MAVGCGDSGLNVYGGVGRGVGRGGSVLVLLLRLLLLQLVVLRRGEALLRGGTRHRQHRDSMNGEPAPGLRCRARTSVA